MSTHAKKLTRRRERRYRRWYNALVRRHALLSRREDREDYLLLEAMTAADFRALSPYDPGSWEPGAEREALTGRRTRGARTVFWQAGDGR